MKYKIWLDDERPAPEGWTHVHTYARAIWFLKYGLVEEISFDHDLGEDQGTGYDVACWVEEHHSEVPPLTWKVHSENPAGAKNIKMAMEKAEKLGFKGA